MYRTEIVKREIEEIIELIFSEENKHEGNFLCESKFWNRYTCRGDCNSGDEYSKPNIKGITSAILSIFIRKLQ